MRCPVEEDRSKLYAKLMDEVESYVGADDGEPGGTATILGWVKGDDDSTALTVVAEHVPPDGKGEPELSLWVAEFVDEEPTVSSISVGGRTALRALRDAIDRTIERASRR